MPTSPTKPENGNPDILDAAAIDRLAGVVSEKALSLIRDRLRWPLILVAAFATYTGYNVWSDLKGRIDRFQSDANAKLASIEKNANQHLERELTKVIEAREHDIVELTNRIRRESAGAALEAERARVDSERSAKQIELEANATIAQVKERASATIKAFEHQREQVDVRSKVVLAQIEQRSHAVSGPNSQSTQVNPPGSPKGLLTQAAFDLIGVTQAIDEVPSGQPVKVAVLSTGISTTAAAGELFRGRLVGSRSFVSGESMDDRNGHGTRVASLIAAIAPSAQIMAIKVLSDRGNGSLGNIVEGLAYAASSGAKVAVLPIGSPPSPNGCSMYLPIFERLRRLGTLVIAGAGNSSLGPTKRGPVDTPANCPPAFAVGATDLQDKLADFTSVGPEVDILAPSDVVTVGPDGEFGTQKGSSFATAIVGGVAALLLSARPELSPDALVTILTKSAKDIQVPADQGGAGRVDALAAIRLAQSSKKTPPS